MIMFSIYGFSTAASCVWNRIKPTSDKNTSRHLPPPLSVYEEGFSSQGLRLTYRVNNSVTVKIIPLKKPDPLTKTTV